MEAAISIAAACLRIGAPRKIAGHIFGCETSLPIPAIPLLRTKLMMYVSSVARSKTIPTTSTIASARKVCTWNNAIDAKRESSPQKGGGPREQGGGGSNPPCSGDVPGGSETAAP